MKKILKRLALLVLFSTLMLLILHREYLSAAIKSSLPQDNSPQEKVVASSSFRSSQEKELIVPNIVHYVWFGKNKTMRFHHFLSVLSAARRLKPDKIYLHCNHEPVGKWWGTLKRDISSLLEIRYREPNKSIYGTPMGNVENQSDIARIDALIEMGGIYFDTDVIALKSFDDLRKYNYTMGIEYHGNPGRLNSGTIVAVKNATFLHIWRSTYKNYTTKEHDVHACQIPYYLQYHYPQHIHVEEKSLNYPNGARHPLIYKKIYDWSKNYAMHLWYRYHDIEHNPEDIKTLNTTFGQIARLTYYGSPDIIK